MPTAVSEDTGGSSNTVSIKKSDIGTIANGPSDSPGTYFVRGEKIKVIRRILGSYDDVSVVVDVAVIRAVSLDAGAIVQVNVILPNDHQFSDVPMVYVPDENVAPIGVVKAPFADNAYIVTLKNNGTAAVTTNVALIVKSINFDSIKHFDYSVILGEVKEVESMPRILSDIAELLGFPIGP